MLLNPGPTLRTCFQYNSTFSTGNKITFGEGISSFEFLSGDRNCSLQWPFAWFVDGEFAGTYFFLRFSYCSSGLEAGLNSIRWSRTFFEDETSLASRSDASLLVISESFEKFVTDGITWTATELIITRGQRFTRQTSVELIDFLLERKLFGTPFQISRLYKYQTAKLLQSLNLMFLVVFFSCLTTSKSSFRYQMRLVVFLVLNPKIVFVDTALNLRAMWFPLRIQLLGQIITWNI